LLQAESPVRQPPGKGGSMPQQRIRADPIPDALVRKVLEAGTRAPSGGNQQRWRFIVIKDPETAR